MKDKNNNNKYANIIKHGIELNFCHTQISLLLLHSEVAPV